MVYMVHSEEEWVKIILVAQIPTVVQISGNLR